jgi:hypothetical protein
LLNDLTVYKNLIITADSDGNAGDDGQIITDGYDIDVFGDLFLGPAWLNDGVLFNTAAAGGRSTTLKLYGQFGGGAFTGMFSGTEDLRLEVLE